MAVQKAQASIASLGVVIAKSRQCKGLPSQEAIATKNRHCEKHPWQPQALACVIVVPPIQTRRLKPASTNFKIM
jgi:hypothetical protein